jgi:hypothetical protein
VTTQHAGAAGELLVQYQLLKVGIDNARLTTDASIDLVVNAPGSAEAIIVQVKANLAAKPAGGKGQLSRGWDFPHTPRSSWRWSRSIRIACGCSQWPKRESSRSRIHQGGSGSCTCSWTRRLEVPRAPDTKDR